MKCELEKLNAFSALKELRIDFMNNKEAVEESAGMVFESAGRYSMTRHVKQIIHFIPL